MALKIASKIYRNRHGTFYFRFVIPKSLQSKINQREIRFSLHTESRQQALAKAIILIANKPDHLLELRTMADETGTTIKNTRLLSFITQVKEKLDAQNENQILLKEIEELKEKLKASTPLEVARRTVISAFDKGQLKGKSQLEQKLIPWDAERTPLFSELKKSYLKSLGNRVVGGVKKPLIPKTLEEYEKTLEFFIFVMGDLKIGEINREIAGDYFRILKQLPANLSKIAKYKNKSIEELITFGDEPQSEVTVSKKIERISTMFKWALDEKKTWGIDANPFAGYGQANTTETKRRSFNLIELKALLNHPNYLSLKFYNSYNFWLIPLGLFSGARLRELCQLEIKDFVIVDNVFCFDINDIEEIDKSNVVNGNKRVKNKNARRLVPIHSALIEMGLLRYIDKLKANGQNKLFPELNSNRRDGPAHAASAWFQRFRKNVGLTIKQETVFHSFRHTFISNILDNEVSPHMLAPIVGHEADLITGKVYWNTRDATKRKPTVEKMLLPVELLKLFPKIEQVTFSKIVHKLK